MGDVVYGLSSAGKSEPPSRDVVRRPEISRYVDGWGRVGDTGFVAHDEKNQALLGAAWLRRPTDKSDASPELALAVKPEHRRHVGQLRGWQTGVASLRAIWIQGR